MVDMVSPEFSILAFFPKEYMDIQILQLIEGAKNAKGLAIIIDVFRAFSLAAYAFANHAEKIIPVGDLDIAFQLKKKNPEFILIGERNEQKIPGFDYGNSPAHILNEDFSGKTIVHSTSASTQGLVSASNADEILTGSFVNAGAIVKYIQAHKPEHVSLVCMGYAATHPIEEDSFCAQYIKNEIEGSETDIEIMFRIIRNTSGRRFFIKDKQDYAPALDFELCTSLNRFNFVIKAERKGDLLELKKINNKDR